MCTLILYITREVIVTIKYYMKTYTTLSKQFSNPINQIVEGGKIIDTQYTTALFLSLVRSLIKKVGGLI
jgi:hypothetical protein